MTIIDCTHPRAAHQHGTYLAWAKDGCRCPPCDRAARRHSKGVRHRTITGTHTYVDATPAREHVRSLLEAGLTLGQVESRSGLDRTAIRVLLGTFPGRPTSKRVTRKTQRALLAVKAEHVGAEAGGYVHAAGTRRRLQALIAAGWTGLYLTERLGMSSATIPKITRTNIEAPVLASTRAAVIDLYDELSLQVPPAGRGRTRARSLARGRGWAPPLAWDDDTIDHPDAEPYAANDFIDKHDVDETAVERVVTGDAVDFLTVAERREVVRRLHAQGFSDGQIGRRAGFADRTALRIRQELGLAAVEAEPGLSGHFGAAGERRRRAARETAAS